MAARTLIHAIASLMFLVLPTLSLAGQGEPPHREADKSNSVKRVMAKRKFEMSPGVRRQDKPFCEVFLQDFQQQKNIEFIEPVAKTDSYDDPV